jgi:hypothetical protein
VELQILSFHEARRAPEADADLVPTATPAAQARRIAIAPAPVNGVLVP